MKKILVAILAVGLISSLAIAANGGGKKKGKKKAKMECKQDKNCDVKNCDLKNCDPTVCPYPVCEKDEKCPTEKNCSGKK